MLEKISPKFRPEIETIVGKWRGFTQKVGARTEEVLAEARAGLDQLIAEHAVDHGPMGAAMNAVQIRFQGLTSKVQEAFSKIDDSIDEVTAKEMSESDTIAIYAVRDVLLKEERALIDQINAHYERLATQKGAEWARQLRTLAEQEVQRGTKCSQCGSPFTMTTYWQASKQTCPHCNAVNDVYPGAAAGLFFQGAGVHALAHEQSFAAYEEELRADRAVKEKRHATSGDFARYLDAARARWTAYYQVAKQLNPGFVGTVEEATEAKLKHYTAFGIAIEQKKREFFGKLVDAAAQKNEGAIKALLGALPAGVDLEECAEALVERGDIDGATIVLTVKHEAEGGTFLTRKGWIKEQLADVARTVRR